MFLHIFILIKNNTFHFDFKVKIGLMLYSICSIDLFHISEEKQN